MLQKTPEGFKGILLVNKPAGKTSFSLVASLRRHLRVKKIGHAGTLDPFATGVMVMLVGRDYTKLSDSLLCQEKEYLAKIRLGVSTDTFDCEGSVLKESDLIPSHKDVDHTLAKFQGEIEQIPPMYSAKKVQGKKLYELARKGVVIERAPVKLTVHLSLKSYQYPYLTFHVTCSKGTYIRSLANDIGDALGCGGHLVSLERLRSGDFRLENCVDGTSLYEAAWDPLAYVSS